MIVDSPTVSVGKFIPIIPNDFGWDTLKDCDESLEPSLDISDINLRKRIAHRIKGRKHTTASPQIVAIAIRI